MEQEFKLPPIKTKEDLTKFLKHLSDHGFGYQSDYKFHETKVDHLINQANKLGINYDNKLNMELYKLNDYDEIKRKAEEHFSKFGVIDKIEEYFKGENFALHSDNSIRTPSGSSPNAKDIIEWVKFRNKLKLKDEFGMYKMVYYYDLDKNILKINFGSYKEWEFKNLYRLVYDEELIETNFNEKRVGDWQDLGKIQIKFFVKGGAAIKGELTKLKELYYNYLKKNLYGHNIIKHQGKQEIIKDFRED